MTEKKNIRFKPRKFQVVIQEIFKGQSKRGSSVSKVLDEEDVKPIYKIVMNSISYSVKEYSNKAKLKM
jgi:hypothetical protein